MRRLRAVGADPKVQSRRRVRLLGPRRCEKRHPMLNAKLFVRPAFGQPAKAHRPCARPIA